MPGDPTWERECAREIALNVGAELGQGRIWHDSLLGIGFALAPFCISLLDGLSA